MIDFPLVLAPALEPFASQRKSDYHIAGNRHALNRKIYLQPSPLFHLHGWRPLRAQTLVELAALRIDHRYSSLANFDFEGHTNRKNEFPFIVLISKKLTPRVDSVFSSGWRPLPASVLPSIAIRLRR